MSKLKIAVIGSGISGLSASWQLSKSCDVEWYEKNDYFGGHANTHTLKFFNEPEFNVDTGFIVFNENNYPNLCKMFKELGKPDTSLSLSYSRVMKGALANKQNPFLF